jgi:hypothetical protein
MAATLLSGGAYDLKALIPLQKGAQAPHVIWVAGVRRCNLSYRLVYKKYRNSVTFQNRGLLLYAEAVKFSSFVKGSKSTWDASRVLGKCTNSASEIARLSNKFCKMF